MKRKLFSAVFIILNAACAASLIFLTVSAVQFGLCFSAAKKIPQIDFQLLRILPYNAADSEISASVSILDTDGEVLAVIERSWHGSFLSVECICASFSENKLYFPKRIYGAKTEYPSLADMGKRSGRGTALFRYYNRDGACLLFGKSRPAFERSSVHKIAFFAFSPASFAVPRFVQKTSVNLSGLESGKYYGVFVEKGVLVVKEE